MIKKGLGTWAQSQVWAKSLRPEFALINQYQKLIISGRIAYCAET